MDSELENTVTDIVNKAIKKTITGDFVRNGRLDEELVKEFVRKQLNDKDD